MLTEIRSYEDLDREITEKKGYVLVDLYAGWCRPCKVMAPFVEYASELLSEVSFCRINIDEQEEMAESFHIPGVPCYVLFHDGEEKGRIIGYHSKDKFLAEIKGLLAK
ncbi:MAG: thioredoxin family protein [Dialister sp.]|nr:thioredoxin family protein [Dialister sp.]